MALGKRKTERQQELFVPADQLPRSPGHVFYRKLNQLLAEAGFDAWLEECCRPCYADGQGREGIPPGTYFRMLLVGYFEGIGSQRGIAWRCSDSLSLRDFLGVPATKESPDHSSLSRIRERLPFQLHVDVFAWILKLAEEKKLLKGKSVAVDSTTLEADAAMKSIVRRDNGEDWKQYVMRLMQEEGVVAEDAQPTDEELRRYDKNRKNKKVSNEEWVSPTDPDSRIARMKDGTTHLAYKAEHVVDLDTNLILAAEVYHANQSDQQTLEDSLHQAQINQEAAGSSAQIQNVAADKGYHSAETLATLAEHTPYRTYIPEPAHPRNRRWTDKPPEQRTAVYANRRRTRGDRGKRLQRLRSEFVERTFAHVCETGGARRSWLHGIEKVRKRHLIAAAAHNLGLLMRTLFKMGTPRGLQAFADLASSLYLTILTLCQPILRLVSAFETVPRSVRLCRSRRALAWFAPKNIRSSTGC
jgi:transposase